MGKRLLLTLLTVCLGFIASAGPGYRLEVVVTDPEQKPVSDILIQVYTGTQLLDEGYTNRDGLILFDKLKSGTISLLIHVDSTKYMAFSEQLTNKKRHDLNRTITLEYTAEYLRMVTQQILSEYDAEHALYACEKTTRNPEFPGGQGLFRNYFNANVNYPLESIELNEQGTIWVAFIVETDGRISNVGVMRGISPALDREARRLIQNMPNWTPELCNGEAQRTRVVLPITFRLN